MPKQNNALQRLCTDANRVKETYYGSAHRATFTLNGEKAEWEIFHIAIPFEPLKEAELMRRFNIDRADLQNFYGNFEKAVVRHINISKALDECGTDALKKSLVEYKSVQYFPRVSKNGTQVGQDFYFISTPMESFIGGGVIKSNGALLSDINSLAIRLLQTAKAFNEAGFTLGAIDLDSCFYASDESGKKYLKLAFEYYGQHDNVRPDVYTEDVRPFVDEELLSGGEQTLDSDVRMICSYIWNILDGKNYTEPNQHAWIVKKFYANQPNKVPDELKPRFAPHEITTLLIQGMIDGANAMRNLQTGIRQYNKYINAGNFENVWINFPEASYLASPLPELRVDEKEEEPETIPAPEEEKNENKASGKKKKDIKISGIIVAALAGLFLFCMAVYFVIGPSGVDALLHPNTVSYSYSSERNIYVSDGKIVNDKMAVYKSLMLDEDGNIVYVEEPENILYSSEYVSEYVFVNNVKLSIVDKKFTKATKLNPEDMIFRDNIVDLRDISVLIYDYSADADNRISRSLMDLYNINEDSVILMNDDPADDTSYAIVMLVDATSSPENAEWIVPDGQGASETITISEKRAGEGSDEEKPSDEEMFPVREITGFSNDNLYLLRGEWRNTVEVHVEPNNALNGRVTLTSDDPEHMYFIVNNDGKESKTRAIKLNAAGAETTSFVIVCDIEGKFTILIESEDGAVSKRIQMTFSRPSSYGEVADPIRPTPTPIPTPTPDVTPTPEPTPTPTPEPTPTPWQNPYSGYSGGVNYYAGGGGTSTPVQTQMPVATPTPMPEQTQAPVYTPAPAVPLTCSVSHIDLAVGESYRLGDYLDGIEYAYVVAIPNPSGIVSINQAEGFLVTAISPGSCVITISKDYESVSVSVTVTG